MPDEEFELLIKKISTTTKGIYINYYKGNIYKQTHEARTQPMTPRRQPATGMNNVIF